jgi:CubicO group peptidase (beta-lactamase class C family)
VPHRRPAGGEKDPAAGRPERLDAHLREELAEPLGLDFHIGLDASLDARCADIIAAPKVPGAPNLFEAAQRQPDSLLAKVFANPRIRDGEVNTRAWRGAEIPAGNGHGTARGLARLYGALVCGGELDGVHVVGPEALARATREEAYGVDAVLGPLKTRFGLGFFLTHPMIPFGPNPNAFGHPGAGGSIAFGDPDAKLGFGYTMNQMQTALAGDARGFSLIREVYAALG